jgi:hypothetical protein
VKESANKNKKEKEKEQDQEQEQEVLLWVIRRIHASGSDSDLHGFFFLFLLFLPSGLAV